MIIFCQPNARIHPVPYFWNDVIQITMFLDAK